jgi:hypothetical protein
MAPPTIRSGDSNPFVDLIEAITDRQGELDIRLEHMTLKLPLVPETIELNGTVTLSVHMRDLTDEEKAAHASKEIRALGA